MPATPGMHPVQVPDPEHQREREDDREADQDRPERWMR